MHPNKAACCSHPRAWLSNISAVEIAPGPANIGTPSGVIAMSSLVAPASTSSLVSCAADRFAGEDFMSDTSRLPHPPLGPWGYGAYFGAICFVIFIFGVVSNRKSRSFD